ncbi:hypothetical protein N665_0870s0019 [Sinapis alba]|nr:hypothetical protein N665_0870s0019 [Sinapis alba]
MTSSTNRKFVLTPIMFMLIFLTKTSFSLSDLMNETVIPHGVLTTKQVVIVNKLGILETLNLHCRNGEKDLGPVSLKPEEKFEFKFLTSIFLPPITYTCSFQWPDAGKELFFDIFRTRRDGNVCDLCIWYVFDGLICQLRPDKKSPTFCHYWDLKRS